MDLSKRASLAASGLLSLGLTAIVVRDVFVDWLVEDKALWSTLVENAVPLGLAVAVGVAAYVVYDRRESPYPETVARWQFAGALGILVVALEVVGLQLVQGELKPYLIVVQMTVGGAAAGTLVGYASADSETARAQVRRERDELQTLVENVPAEVVEVRLADGEPTIEDVNETFEETFGVATADAEEERLFEFIDHDDATRRHIRDAIAVGETAETGVHTATVEGPKDFQLRIVPLADEPRAYLLYTDVTELQRTRSELESTVDRLEKSNERLQQFAYVASHDLQEPARMVASYVSLLETEYGEELDEEAREYMDFAVDGADRMQDMIDALLDYSRVSSQAQEFTVVDAERVFEETLTDLDVLVDEHDVTVTHDDLPTVQADRNQLGQVFQNLVENAVEHGSTSPPSHAREDAVGHAVSAIHVGAETRDGEVVFSVADDGPGIPEDQQERIFEIFEQGSRDDDGTGIGLAICDRIVSRHGGEMWVESAEGEGTTFYFSMPS